MKLRHTCGMTDELHRYVPGAEDPTPQVCPSTIDDFHGCVSDNSTGVSQGWWTQAAALPWPVTKVCRIHGGLKQAHPAPTSRRGTALHPWWSDRPLHLILLRTGEPRGSGGRPASATQVTTGLEFALAGASYPRVRKSFSLKRQCRRQLQNSRSENPSDLPPSPCLPASTRAVLPYLPVIHCPVTLLTSRTTTIRVRGIRAPQATSPDSSLTLPTRWRRPAPRRTDLLSTKGGSRPHLICQRTWCRGTCLKV